MTKTKRNLILVVSLLFAIFTLCSVFAGVSFHTPQTVEAAETTDTRAPGLYETGTTTFVKDGDKDMTWDYLIDNGDVKKETNARLSVVTKTLAGDLICGGFELGSEQNLDLCCSFSGCTELTHIDISGWAREGVWVSDGTSTFEGCKKLVSVIMPKDARWVSGELAEYTFYMCESLKKIDWNGAKFEYMQSLAGMFWGCESLETIDSSFFNFTKGNELSQVNEMFKGCKSLETVDLSSLNMENVYEGADDMFAGCTSLKTIIAPKSMGADVEITLPAGEEDWKVQNSDTVVTAITSANCGATLVRGSQEVASTGVVANVYMTAIAIVSIASLAFVATKKKRARNYH